MLGPRVCMNCVCVYDYKDPDLMDWACPVCKRTDSQDYALTISQENFDKIFKPDQRDHAKEMLEEIKQICLEMTPKNPAYPYRVGDQSYEHGFERGKEHVAEWILEKIYGLNEEENKKND